jgi:hypothetical protein
MKGRLRDQVTESSCGCFLAQAVVSQWLCVMVALVAARRVRQSRRTPRRLTGELRGIHVHDVCM